MPKINYTFTDNCFLKNAEYSCSLPNLFKKFEESFGNAQIVNVTLEELVPHIPNILNKQLIKISSDGNIVDLCYSTRRFLIQKRRNRKFELPDPKSELDSITNFMKNMSDGYLDQFPTKKVEI